MRLVQSVRDGALRLEDSARPAPSPTQVLIETRSSLISSGTERSIRELASASLLAKARARPDLVREVLRRVRDHGIGSTLGAVQGRLAEDMPLGYSAAGIVLEVGEAVSGIRPGQRVATAGAPHADLQLASGLLVVRLPDSVSFDDGAFVTVATIALNGLRLAGVEPGARVLVVGLGLIGQLVARIALASGASVTGIDPVPWKRELAAGSGVKSCESDSEGWDEALAQTGGIGFDAIAVTAATKSSDPMQRAARAARDQGVLVLVGDAGLDLDRRPLYEKQLTVKVARAYGPGRYDPVFEDLGVAYPIGGVRWNAQTNMIAVADLIASGRLVVADLITHRYPFDEAVDAYAVLEDRDARSMGIVLQYLEGPHPIRASESRSPSSGQQGGDLTGVGLIGAGRFARDVLLPAAKSAGFGGWTSVHSAGGSSAYRIGKELGFTRVAAAPSDVIDDPETNTVMVATHHDSHAALVESALRAGKHVFCEKPLAISEAELEAVEQAYRVSTGFLMVGFNRRWSPAIAEAARLLEGSAHLQVMYRINAGKLPTDHWLNDRRMGGRLLGEGCHFIDTCDAIIGQAPRSVLTLTSGTGELILEQDFTISLGYPNGSQAVIVYTSSSSTRPGKEYLEILGSGWSVHISDFARLTAYGPRKKVRRSYRPADKGHRRELEVFAGLVSGTGDAARVADDALVTSRVALAAIRSATTGEVVHL